MVVRGLLSAKRICWRVLVCFSMFFLWRNVGRGSRLDFFLLPSGCAPTNAFANYGGFISQNFF